MKKEFKILLLISFVVIVLMSVLITISKINFKKNMEKATFNMLITSIIADEVTRGYSDIWRAYIKTDRYNQTYYKGEYHYFYDINAAIDFQKNNYKQNGDLQKMDSLLIVSKIQVEKIEKSWFGNSDKKKCCINLYYDLWQLCNEANSPTGSYETFNLACELLSNSISRNVAELESYLPKWVFN